MLSGCFQSRHSSVFLFVVIQILQIMPFFVNLSKTRNLTYTTLWCKRTALYYYFSTGKLIFLPVNTIYHVLFVKLFNSQLNDFFSILHLVYDLQFLNILFKLLSHQLLLNTLYIQIPDVFNLFKLCKGSQMLYKNLQATSIVNTVFIILGRMICSCPWHIHQSGFPSFQIQPDALYRHLNFRGGLCRKCNCQRLLPAFI